MNLKSTITKSYDYVIFLVLFLIIVPGGYALGLISINTVSLWGRYFCFAIAAIGVDILWGYTGILCLCQAFFFCVGGYGIAMHMLLVDSGSGRYGEKIPDFMVWNQVDSLPFSGSRFIPFRLRL